MRRTEKTANSHERLETHIDLNPSNILYSFSFNIISFVGVYTLNRDFYQKVPRKKISHVLLVPILEIHQNSVRSSSRSMKILFKNQWQ